MVVWIESEREGVLLEDDAQLSEFGGADDVVRPGCMPREWL